MREAVNANTSVIAELKMIMQQVIDSGRAMVLVVNKWDLVDEERRMMLNKELDRNMVQMPWVERVNISAETGWHTNRLTYAMRAALDSWDKRISTGKLNAALGALVAATPHPVRGGKQARILFATQVDVQPPRFVLFTTGFLEHGYRRFIERHFRETFDFTGSPIEIAVRERQRRERR